MQDQSTKHPDLYQMRKTARKAATREGYDQVIIQAHDGSLSVNRSYPGCCPAWYGRIIEKFKIINMPTGAITQWYAVSNSGGLARPRLCEERSHT